MTTQQITDDAATVRSAMEQAAQTKGPLDVEAAGARAMLDVIVERYGPHQALAVIGHWVEAQVKAMVAEKSRLGPSLLQPPTCTETEWAHLSDATHAVEVAREAIVVAALRVEDWQQVRGLDARTIEDLGDA